MSRFAQHVFFLILLFSQMSIASQQEGVSFFYEEKTNIEWVTGKQNFSNLTIDAPMKNFVLFGEFSSDDDINIKAKNLIILGSLLSTKNMRLYTSHNLFNVGSITAKDLSIDSEKNVYLGLDDKAIQEIQALGIAIKFSDDEHHHLQINVPTRKKSI